MLRENLKSILAAPLFTHTNVTLLSMNTGPNIPFANTFRVSVLRRSDALRKYRIGTRSVERRGNPGQSYLVDIHC